MTVLNGNCLLVLFKKKDRWRRVASSIALVVKLTAMLEAWWVDVVGSNQPRVLTAFVPTALWSAVKKYGAPRS